MKPVKIILPSLIALFIVAIPCPAQIMQSGIGPALPNASAASYYYISKPGELTMQVNIWGAIKNPGCYEVPTSTDLVQLVSYAGGPLSEASLDEVRITRSVRQDSTKDRDQITVDLNHLSHVNQSQLVLHPGDTIFIDRSGWSNFRDALPVVTTVALITSAIAYIIIAEKR